MQTRIPRALIVVVLGIFAFFQPTNVGQAADRPAIVVSDRMSNHRLAKKELTLNELIDIFTKRKTRWEDGTEILVVTQKANSPAQTEFILSVLGMTPYQYRTRLTRNIYRGKATPPLEVSSEEELFEKILTHDNAIGYIYDYTIIKKNKKIVIIAVKEE